MFDFFGPGRYRKMIPSDIWYFVIGWGAVGAIAIAANWPAVRACVGL